MNQSLALIMFSRLSCPNEKIFIHNAQGKSPLAVNGLPIPLSSVENYLDPSPTVHTKDDFDSAYTSSELDTKILENLMPATVLVDEKNTLQHSYGSHARTSSRFKLVR